MKTKEEFGHIDIVCNIAGITLAEDWRKILDINLVSFHVLFLDNGHIN